MLTISSALPVEVGFTRDPGPLQPPGPVSSGWKYSSRQRSVACNTEKGTGAGTAVTVRVVLLLDSVLSSGGSGAAPNDQLTPKRQKDEYVLSAQEPAKPAHLAPSPGSVPVVPRRKLRQARGLDPGHTSEQLGAKVRSQGICPQILCFPRFLRESGPDCSGRGVPLTISRAASLTLPRAART